MLEKASLCMGLKYGPFRRLTYLSSGLVGLVRNGGFGEKVLGKASLCMGLKYGPFRRLTAYPINRLDYHSLLTKRSGHFCT